MSSGRSKLAERVRRANAPKPPEGSVRLRVACAASAAVALAAAASEHEMSASAAVAAAMLVAGGMGFSHRYRHRSLGWVKIVVAAGATATLAAFVERLYRVGSGGLAAVEAPLTVLLAAILVLHSMHVPARRDLLFALAGSAALMAVAAAAAVDMRFAVFAAIWSTAALWALIECGASAAGARPGGGQWVTAMGATVAVAVSVFLLLPAPTADVNLDFRSAPGSAGTESTGGLLAGDGGRPTELSRPGSPAGPTRVGGYLGFAGALDTATRAGLSHQLVMRVRATFPSYWVGETFDRWDGHSWSSTVRARAVLGGGSPFYLPPDSSTGGGTRSDVQTFYVEASAADMVFHAAGPQQIWFPASKLVIGGDGSIVSPVGIGKGAIYTVQSAVPTVTAGALRRAAPNLDSPNEPGGAYTALPQPYERVKALAQTVTAGAADDYDRVQALIAWIAANTRYSTDIPALPPGADAVEQFLFGNRTGYCEQISTALAVMLRTLGIPAREVVGYVPGSYNPVTDLYEVRADDAHAWVQVWFPGYGWQDFDPTASVPAANPAPGLVALHDLYTLVAPVPWRAAAGPLGAVVAVAAGVVATRHWRRRGGLSPAGRAVLRMERAGRQRGQPRKPAETVTELAHRLGGGWPDVAAAVGADRYGGRRVGRAEWDRLLAGALRSAEGVQE